MSGPFSNSSVATRKKLVRSALEPPVIMRSPLGSIAMPGQNMSWLVTVMAPSVVSPVAGSKMACMVRPTLPVVGEPCGFRGW